MAVPNTFEAGEVASSSEVNENFAWVADRIGNDSTEEQLRPPGDLILGPRDAVQLTAMGDTGAGAADGYVQLSWNAELYDSGGGVFKLRRFINGEGAAAIRVGNTGVGIWATGNTLGDLHTQVEKVLHARIHETTPWIYVNEGWHFQNADAEPAVGNIGSFRTTLVLLDPAVELVAPNSAMDRTTITRDIATISGAISQHAVALMISAKIKATNNSEATLNYAQAGEGTPDALKTGWTLTAGKGNTEQGVGIVRLGYHGEYKGKFVEERTAQINNGTIYITGYYV